jgi:hypothetical protein
MLSIKGSGLDLLKPRYNHRYTSSSEICAPLLADLFLYMYSYEAELLQDYNKKLAMSFNHTFRYIDDVLSINNHDFHNYVLLIYPDELEIKGHHRI